MTGKLIFNSIDEYNNFDLNFIKIKCLIKKKKRKKWCT